MKRYDTTPIEIDEKGKRVYKTTIFPTIEPNESDMFIVSRWGDRLDLLAHRYYGDSTYWWVIAEANHIVNGSFFIPTGTKLRIPSNLNVILSQLETLQQSR